MPRTLAFFLLLPMLTAGATNRVHSLDIRILSTMLADGGFGEWGFSALVVADGHRILFDTGAHPDTVLRNAKELNVDLSNVPDVILSHNHYDHTAGLITLKREYPKSFLRAHSGRGILARRLRADGSDANKVPAMKTDFEALGGKFLIYDHATEVYPGIWLTGPVTRKYPERNWSGSLNLASADGKKLGEDNLPEDQSLVFDTDQGLVVLSGCGHSGIINTLEQARSAIRNTNIHAAIGGFHLYEASDDTLAWTAGKLKEFGLQNFLGAHCTGIEAVYRIRELVGLNRKTAAVGATGGGFTLASGLAPGSISR